MASFGSCAQVHHGAIYQTATVPIRLATIVSFAGGTGKYTGITGSEPFACNSLPALAGEGGYTSMDIPHNTTWEIKKAAHAE
jgi:hypothetical protein